MSRSANSRKRLRRPSLYVWQPSVTVIGRNHIKVKEKRNYGPKVEFTIVPVFYAEGIDQYRLYKAHLKRTMREQKKAGFAPLLFIHGIGLDGTSIFGPPLVRRAW